jgi:hypothetical protein
MNLKTTKMSEYKFYFDEDTVNYYVKESEKFGNFHTAFEIYKYIADECDYDGETDMRALYLDLLKQVEDGISK